MMLLFLALACSETETTVEAPEPEQPAPVVEEAPKPSPLESLTIDALRSRLSSPSDKVRVFNFWAHWCKPCIAELPTLRDYASKNPEVEVVLINVDSHSAMRSRVQPFIEKVGLDGMNHIHLDNKDSAVALRTLPDWPDTIPVTWIVKPDGQKLKQFTTEVHAAELDEAVRAAR